MPISFFSTSLEQLVSLLLKAEEKNVCIRRNIWAPTTRSLTKLKANETFGKTCEQLRNRVNVQLIADQTKMMKAVSKVSVNSLMRIWSWCNRRGRK